MGENCRRDKSRLPLRNSAHRTAAALDTSWHPSVPDVDSCPSLLDRRNTAQSPPRFSYYTSSPTCNSGHLVDLLSGGDRLLGSAMPGQREEQTAPTAATRDVRRSDTLRVDLLKHAKLPRVVASVKTKSHCYSEGSSSRRSRSNCQFPLTNKLNIDHLSTELDAVRSENNRIDIAKNFVDKRNSEVAQYERPKFYNITSEITKLYKMKLENHSIHDSCSNRNSVSVHKSDHTDILQKLPNKKQADARSSESLDRMLMRSFEENRINVRSSTTPGFSKSARELGVCSVTGRPGTNAKQLISEFNVKRHTRNYQPPKVTRSHHVLYQTPRLVTERHYILDQTLPFQEDLCHEFKGHRSISFFDIPVSCVDKLGLSRNSVSSLVII